jgi:hypothetical protein
MLARPLHLASFSVVAAQTFPDRINELSGWFTGKRRSKSLVCRILFMEDQEEVIASIPFETIRDAL